MPAFWVFSSEADRWRLVIASPIRDREGGVKAYSRLGSVYDSIDPPIGFPITDVAIVGATDRRVKALKKRFVFKREQADTVIENASLDGVYFESVYLYPLSEV